VFGVVYCLHMDVYPLAKMNAYLRKIIEEIGIDIGSKRILGQDLCKINKHFLQFPYKTNLNCVNHLPHDKLIYHNNLLISTLGILIFTLGIHCW